MGVKVTIPNTGSDYLTFGSANTADAAKVGGYEDSTGNGHLELYTTASGTSTERMRINSAGNVGIGTSSPDAKLHVQDGTIRTKQSSTAGNSVIYATNAGGNNVGFWKFGSTAGSYGVIAAENGAVFNSSGDLCIVNDAASKNIIFANNGAAIERMRIDSSGNLLVGTTGTPTNGGYVFYAGTGGNADFGHANGTPSGYSYVRFLYNGSSIGSITQNGTTATSYNTSSDYRLKENIQPMQGALAVVQQLNPVTYTWKADGSDGQGFIAHELQAVVPDCVTGEKDAVDAEGNPVYQGIDTSFLVATLTKAIQEQQAQIETLTAKVAALEAK